MEVSPGWSNGWTVEKEVESGIWMAGATRTNVGWDFKRQNMMHDTPVRNFVVDDAVPDST